MSVRGSRVPARDDARKRRQGWAGAPRKRSDGREAARGSLERARAGGSSKSHRDRDELVVVVSETPKLARREKSVCEREALTQPPTARAPRARSRSQLVRVRAGRAAQHGGFRARTIGQRLRRACTRYTTQDTLEQEDLASSKSCQVRACAAHLGRDELPGAGQRKSRAGCEHQVAAVHDSRCCTTYVCTAERLVSASKIGCGRGAGHPGERRSSDSGFLHAQHSCPLELLLGQLDTLEQ